MRNAALTYGADFFDDTLAITCIESALLGYMRTLNMPYESLYCHSYIDLNTTVTDFLSSDYNYTNYKILPRLQETASLLQLMQTNIKSMSYDSMIIELQTSATQCIPLLLEVDPSCIALPNHELPWREDHFIFVYCIQDSEVLFLDNYPARQGSISISNLKDAYSGAVGHFFIVNLLNINNYRNICLNAIINICNVEVSSCFCRNTYILSDLLSLRDAVGILRISRRRISRWLEWLKQQKIFIFKESVQNHLLEAIIAIDRLYSVIEYCRTKKVIKSDLISTMFQEIYQSEKQWIEQLGRENHVERLE